MNVSVDPSLVLSDSPKIVARNWGFILEINLCGFFKYKAMFIMHGFGDWCIAL